MNIQTLVDNWKDYDISWTGLSLTGPTALMFDPKGDGKKLVGDIWHKVGSKGYLLAFINFLHANESYHPIVWRITGPNGDLYGYLYSGWNHTAIKPIDKTTLLVYGIPATLQGESGY